MAGLALKTTTTKIITKNYTRMKFIGLWAYYYLEWYLQTYVLTCMYGTVNEM